MKITIELTPSQHAELKALGARRGLSVENVIASLLRMGVAAAFKASTEKKAKALAPLRRRGQLR